MVENAIEHRLMELFKPTGLLPSYPHDMDEIMSTADEHTHIDFETEATISTLVGALAATQDYNPLKRTLVRRMYRNLMK